MRSAKGCAVKEVGPDDRGRPRQPKQRPAEPERDQAEHGNKQVADDHRHRKHQQVDQEREHPPCQHAAKQLGLYHGIEGMPLKIHPAVAPGAAGISRTAVRHGRPPKGCIPESQTWEPPRRLQNLAILRNRNHTRLPLTRRRPCESSVVGWAKPTGRANARPMTGSACPPSVRDQFRWWARREERLPTLQSSPPPSASPPPAAQSR